MTLTNDPKVTPPRVDPPSTNPHTGLPFSVADSPGNTVVGSVKHPWAGLAVVPVKAEATDPYGARLAPTISVRGADGLLYVLRLDDAAIDPVKRTITALELTGARVLVISY